MNEEVRSEGIVELQDREMIARLLVLRDRNIAAQSRWSLAGYGEAFPDIRNEVERLIEAVDRRDAELIVEAINALPRLLTLAQEALVALDRTIGEEAR